MAMAKKFVTVRVDQPIYDDVVAELDHEKPKPTITHLANTLLAEAIEARRLKRQKVKAQ